MNPSLDYDVTTCRYAPGSWKHDRLIMAHEYATDLQVALRDGSPSWFVASCALRLQRSCAMIDIHPRVTHKNVVELTRDGECVYRMAVCDE